MEEKGTDSPASISRKIGWVGRVEVEVKSTRVPPPFPCPRETFEPSCESLGPFWDMAEELALKSVALQVLLGLEVVGVEASEVGGRMSGSRWVQRWMVEIELDVGEELEQELRIEINPTVSSYLMRGAKGSGGKGKEEEVREEQDVEMLDEYVHPGFEEDHESSEDGLDGLLDKAKDVEMGMEQAESPLKSRSGRVLRQPKPWINKRVYYMTGAK
ncbi:hypothetical protein BT69DRAFT_1295682 [Atractiella rhizophila]|nr:hypothetical protein BT69DRAFT_1295682 [Atractiella rhizophila]